MIFIGYQGIGKSTFCKDRMDAIDFESSNFKYQVNNHGTLSITRDKYWFMPYTNIAKDLSNQGYSVFISSHKDVRLQLVNRKDVVAIVPALNLRDKWVKKLKDRYETELAEHNPNAEKHKFAYLNAEDCYVENIQNIMNDIKNIIIIENIDYDLNQLITDYVKNHT